MRTFLLAILALTLVGCVPSGQWMNPFVTNTTDKDVLLHFQTNSSRESEELQVVLPPGGRFLHEKPIFVPTGRLAPTADASFVGSQDAAIRITFCAAEMSFELKWAAGALTASPVQKEPKP